MDNLDKMHPVNFFKDKVLQNSDIGTPEVYPILQEIQHMNTKGQQHQSYIEDTLRDFVINNITGLTNTFIMKLLEDNLSSDEIAYMVDFYQDFHMKEYLMDTITKGVLVGKDPDSICNLIQSNIIFILNQFIQFYSMYKIVYNKEGIDLYDTLYKLTYGESPTQDIRIQDKYVFCNCILSNMLEGMILNIKDCCESLKVTIYNIKMLAKGGN